MTDEETNYESDAEIDSIVFTRPKGPNAPPTPYLFVANCGAEAEMTYPAIADVFAAFGHVRRVVPAGAANHTRVFVVFGGRTRAEAAAAAAAAREALSGKPCAQAGGRKMHIQFAVGKLPAQVEHPVVYHSVDALDIPGLFLHLDIVTPEMEQTLLEFADGNDWHYLTKRRVQHHGYAFNYTTRDIEKDKWIGPLPAAVSDFVSRAEALPELTGCPEVCMPLDQLTINEYEAGVGLAPHIDTHAAFEGAILSLSLAGPAIMEFRRPRGPQPVGVQPIGKKKMPLGSGASAGNRSSGNGNCSGSGSSSGSSSSSYGNGGGSMRKEDRNSEDSRPEEGQPGKRSADSKQIQERRAEDRRVLFLPPRSLLVLTGEARYAWSHYIPNHKTDHINGCPFPRGPRRVSFTFRRVRFGACACSYPEFCDALRKERCLEKESPLGSLPGSEDLLAGSMQKSHGQGRREVEEGLEMGTVRCNAVRWSHEGVQEEGGGDCLEGSVEESVEERVGEGVGDENENEEVEGKGKGNEKEGESSEKGGDVECTPAAAAGEDTAAAVGEDTAAAEAEAAEAEAAPGAEKTPAVEREFVHRVYDAIAPHFSATRFARWPKVTQFLLSLPPGSLVLDAGCGNGKYLNGGLPVPSALPAPAASAPAPSSTPASASASAGDASSSSPFSSSPPSPQTVLIGCDISPPLTAICAQRGFEVFAADTLSLPLASSRFDAAISVAVLHHLSSESRRKQALKEMLRVVSRGGRVLVTVWAREQENPGLIDKWTPLIGRMADRWVGDVEEGGGEKGGEGGREGGVGLSGIEEDREMGGEEEASEQRNSGGKEEATERSAGLGRTREDGNVGAREDGNVGAREDGNVGAREEKTEQCNEGAGADGLGGVTGSEESAVHEVPQEFLVPWHLPCHRVEIGSAAAAQHVASGFARRDEKKGSVVYNRYYYVFTQGELERLITEVGGATIVESFYDKSNWCVIMEKL